jgi:stage II sporulation protein D
LKSAVVAENRVSTRLSFACVAAAAMVVAACVTAPGRAIAPAPVPRLPALKVRVQVREGTALIVREVALEDYVTAAALSEVHPDAADGATAEEMFEVQTVLARSYARTNLGRHAKDGFDFCSTTHCQLYEPARLASSRWVDAVRAADRRTSGRILWFAGAPARAVFHADCGGHTSAAAAVWGGVAPAYLAGRSDDGVAAAAHAPWTLQVRQDALRAALNSDSRTAVGATLANVEVAGRDEAGRAEQIVLRGARTFVVRGEVFRDVVTRSMGPKSLRSTLFTVTRTSGTFVFAGRGYGHGVGLCQAGALARLRAGASPAEVLAYYFPGTQLR